MTVLRPRIMVMIISLAVRSESPASTRSARSTTAGLGLRGRDDEAPEPLPPPPPPPGEPMGDDAADPPPAAAVALLVPVPALAGVAGRERGAAPGPPGTPPGPPRPPGPGAG